MCILCNTIAVLCFSKYIDNILYPEKLKQPKASFIIWITVVFFHPVTKNRWRLFFLEYRRGRIIFIRGRIICRLSFTFLAPAPYGPYKRFNDQGQKLTNWNFNRYWFRWGHMPLWFELSGAYANYSQRLDTPRTKNLPFKFILEFV